MRRRSLIMCAEYRKDYRSKNNFVKSNVLVMDCDNDHSEDPEEWMTEEKLAELLPDVSYAIAYSRNHMKEKDGRVSDLSFMCISRSRKRRIRIIMRR